MKWKKRQELRKMKRRKVKNKKWRKMKIIDWEVFSMNWWTTKGKQRDLKKGEREWEYKKKICNKKEKEIIFLV